MFFLEQYSLRHSMELADALIGATSLIKNLSLVTANDKHYKYLPEINIQKFIV